MAKSGAGISSDAAQASGDEYQVFLSFRGSDTRHGFTDFLYHGLMDAGVRVFKDDDEHRVGEVIGENLLHTMRSAILYIPIFSRTYASSIRCLRELALMVDHVSESEGRKSILPIFLDVELEDVKLRTPLYRAAFEKHKEDFPDEVEAWRKALTEVDGIKGWNVEKDQSQATIVKLVVERVLEKLEINQKSVARNLVGLDDQVKHLIELLDVDHQDVRFIIIYGKGGIGKTTIAKVIFNELSSHFGKFCSFLENIRESSLTKEGIVQFQRKLLSDIVGYGSAEQLMVNEQAMRRIGDPLSTKKVLVVLDDADKKEHIKKIIGVYSLHSGSRIIITTRNKIVLNAKELKAEILCYEMLKMDDALALQLFCQHAFNKDFPSDIYHGLSSKIVSITGGFPLVIEVIGSLLNGKDEAFWKETLVRLNEVPDEDIMEMLRISYDNLDRYQQQIFLDVACFLFNENKTEAIYMWADCQFYPRRGLKILTDRCLIKISDNDKIWMHDQLIDLGRRIVRQESPFNPGKRSRLWTIQEALEIMRTKKRKDDVQALKICRSGDSIEITDEEFERLQNLRLLELNWGTYAGDFARCHSNLRWFSWHSPQDFRADNMYLEHLVVCKLDTIDFKDDSKAWDLIKKAQNMKVLSITRCSGITRVPNFSKCLCLERLTLANCFSLERIESFIGDLGSLIELKIEQCQGLRDLPEELGALVKLKHLSLSGCRGLRELPGSLGNLTSLTELNLWGTSIAKSPGMPLLRHAQEIHLDTSNLESKLDKGVKRKWKMIDGSVNQQVGSSLSLGLGRPSSSWDSKGSSGTATTTTSSAKETDEESSMDLDPDFALSIGNDKAPSRKKVASPGTKATELQPKVDLELRLSTGPSESDITCIHPSSSQICSGQEVPLCIGGYTNVDESLTWSCGKSTMYLDPFHKVNTETSFFQSQDSGKTDLIPAVPDLSSSVISTPKSSITCTSGLQISTSRMCQVEGCGKGARGASGFCISHGGGRRCQKPGCHKGAEGRTVYCKAHGGGRRCEFLGCTKSAEGRTDFCIAHGGGRRCTHDGCTRAARGKSGLCIRHGGGKRCQKENCTKSAEGLSGLCISHGGGRRSQYGGCTKGTEVAESEKKEKSEEKKEGERSSV